MTYACITSVPPGTRTARLVSDSDVSNDISLVSPLARQRRGRAARALVGAVLGSVILGSCGGDAPTTSPATIPATPTPPQTPTAPASPAPPAAPLIVRFDPPVAPVWSVGTAEDTLRVIGDHFAPGAVVSWDGRAVPTVYGDSTLLRVPLASALIARVDTVAIVVTNPAPRAATSETVPFVVGYPVPILDSVTPRLLGVGLEQPLSLYGRGLVPGATLVRFSAGRVGTFVVLRVAVPDRVAPDRYRYVSSWPGDLLPSGGTLRVLAVNPAPAGGLSTELSVPVVPVSVAAVSLITEPPTSTTVGSFYRVRVRLEDSTSAPIAGRTITWTSSDSTVLSFHSSRAVGTLVEPRYDITVEAFKAGAARITASVDGRSASVDVAVRVR